MIIKNFTREELDTILYDWNTRKFKIEPINNGYGVYHFKDFRYFSPDNLMEGHGEANNCFLVAFDERNPLLIYGVADYGQYGYDRPYFALSYIDVNKRYRRQGVATKLIIAGNELLGQMGIKQFGISSLSDEGQAAHLDILGQRLITNAVLFVA